MPPIVLFRARGRPKGLEFASCAECNHGAKHSDLVAAMFGRCFPDIEKSEHEEVKKIFSGVRNNIPGLLEEMFVDPRSEIDNAIRLGLKPGSQNFIAMDGPVSMRYLRAFGARFGMAMYFHETGKIVPPGGGASARIYSNIDLASGVVPQQLFDILPEPSTLAAGRNTVESQFRYSAQTAIGDGLTIAFATFRRSFGVMAAAANDISKLMEPDFPPAAIPLQPGFLKGM